MSSSYFINPFIFIVDTLFTLYILALMIRLFLQWVRADFYNPIAQFLLTITQPVLRPLRRFFPPIGITDTASLFLLVALAMLKLTIISGVVGSIPPFSLLFLASLGDLVSLGFNIFKFAIIIQVILSWVAPGTYNPGTTLLYDLTEPILRPARNLLPPIGGLDLSPLIALVGLQVVSMLVEPLFPRIF